MTREQIEKAANIEMLSHYADEEYPCGIKDIQSDFIGAFSKGAEWRINSVWHSTNNELPQHSGYLAVLMGNGLTEVIHYTVGVGIHEMALKGYTLWAYVSDLLPERKEETNGGR